MAQNTFVKDPNARLSYMINWVDWLAGDTISTSTWAASPTGITVVSDSKTTTSATVTLSGGTAGAIYALTNHITTAAADQDDRTIYIIMEER